MSKLRIMGLIMLVAILLAVPVGGLIAYSARADTPEDIPEGSIISEGIVIGGRIIPGYVSPQSIRIYVGDMTREEIKERIQRDDILGMTREELMEGLQRGDIPVGYINPKSILFNFRELGIQSLAEFEALFPPNRDGEFIVHDIPELPVVIDGVRYEPEDIHLFNGQVLRFVVDDEALREGVIYAFTTPEGKQRFVEERWGIELFQDNPEKPGEISPLFWVSSLYEHWNMGGRRALFLHPQPGYIYGYPSLGWFDNLATSASVAPVGPITLFCGVAFAGNSRTLGAGTSWIWLGLLWNDRTSSVITWP